MIDGRIIMGVQELYRIIGGDYNDVIGRLGNDQRVSKFVKLFLADDSYENFIVALNNNDYENAFRAIHTLKGVCLNLGFLSLFKIVDEMTELIRASQFDCAKSLLSELTLTYEKYILAIDEFNKG